MRSAHKYVGGTIWKHQRWNKDIWIEILDNAGGTVVVKKNGQVSNRTTTQVADYMNYHKPLLVVKDNSEKGYYLFDTFNR